ncbi:MAG: IS110 family transposase [Azospirillum sp.]|nr:IS110 family transposase [Azospirillum sp.]
MAPSSQELEPPAIPGRFRIDIAKSVFQVHAADGTGATVYTKKLSRGQVLPFFTKQPPAMIGMEACATSHHWARELVKLGHEVRLLPPTAVKPFVKRGKKNDAADAAAICEAMIRPSIYSVPVKTEEQQSVLALHTVREQLVAVRTGFVNAVRAHFAEHGMVVGLGRGKLAELATMRPHLPDRTAFAVDILLGRIKDLDADIAGIEKKLMEFHKTCEESRNLATIPSVGPLAATLIVAKIGDPSRFNRGPNFAAWLGMVPRQNSSGGKERLGAITKAGDQSIRRMLFLGATSMVWRAKPATWLGKLRDRKPAKLAAMALANKTARIIWAVLTRGEVYRETIVAAV